MKLVVQIILGLVLFWAQNSIADDFIYAKGFGPNGWRVRAANADGLRVMWWNLGCTDAPDLIQNLKRVLQMVSPAGPDVLILGEYCPYKLKEYQNGILEMMNVRFPHQYEVRQYTKYHHPDYNSPVNGIRVLSRYKFKNLDEVQLDGGHWLRGEDMSRCKSGRESEARFQKDRYSFPYVDFEVEKAGQKYNVVGVHFPNPWNVMAECRGKIKTLYNLLRSTANPTYAHAHQLTRRFENAEQTLILGDFNAPKTIKLWFWRYKSKPYGKLAREFGRSVITEGTATANSKMGSFSIDHAFASDDLRVPFAEVIGLAGSDHKPIYVVIQPDRDPGVIPGLPVPDIGVDFSEN